MEATLLNVNKQFSAAQSSNSQYRSQLDHHLGKYSLMEEFEEELTKELLKKDQEISLLAEEKSETDKLVDTLKSTNEAVNEKLENKIRDINQLEAERHALETENIMLKERVSELANQDR